MRLVTYISAAAGPPRIGALVHGDQAIVDVKAMAAKAGRDAAAFESMQALIDSGRRGLAAAKELIALARDAEPADRCRLLAPLPVPAQIRDCMGFEQHLVNAYNTLRRKRANLEPDPAAALARFEREGMFKIPDVFYRQPIYYKGNRFSVIGPCVDAIWPSYAEVMDFELEFAAVIGRKGRDIAKSDAHAHIFGYTIFNDLSARDAQTIEMPGLLGPAKCKDFDTGNILGPCIVTADEIDPYNLDMFARINGEEWSRGNSRTMTWRFDDMIAHISRSETLYPGEVIGSGTVGTGCGLELDRFLTPGDTIELEVEGIGVLKNRIVRTTATKP